jgi:SLA1 homology domain 1, SHD1
MRRLIVLMPLLVSFLCGCGSAAQDVSAAREYVKRSYSNPGIDLKVDKVEGPEYANVEKIPRDHIAQGHPDRSAACAVRVWFTWRDGRSTVHDSWIVWVSKDHKGVGFSDPSRDEWRNLVKSVAKQSSANASVTPTTVSYQPEPGPPSAARDPEPAPPVAASKPEPARTTANSRLWTKADRSAQVRATFLSLSGNIVKLRQRDGMEIRVSLDQLSQADRDWIEENRQKAGE